MYLAIRYSEMDVTELVRFVFRGHFLRRSSDQQQQQAKKLD